MSRDDERIRNTLLLGTPITDAELEDAGPLIAVVPRHPYRDWRALLDMPAGATTGPPG